MRGTTATAAAAAPTIGAVHTAADPVRPDWLGSATEAPRGRVVRSDDPLVQVVDLPTVEELDEEDANEHDDGSGEDEARSGGAAVTWALGYRVGHDAGREEGHRAGYEDGLRLGLERATAEAVARYEAVLDELRRVAADHLAQLEGLQQLVATQSTELAFGVAREVIGRELALSADPGADAVRRALAAVPGRADATARLHPEDLARLGRTPEELDPSGALRLVADPTLRPGDCVLSSGATSVDAGIDSALARVRAALELRDGADRTSGDEAVRP